MANLVYAKGPHVSGSLGSLLVFGKSFLVRCLALASLSMAWVIEFFPL